MGDEARFCTSADGTRLAFTVHGSGPPVVLHSLYELGSIGNRASRYWLQAIPRRHSVIRFDARGMGLSDRDDAIRIGIDAWVEDLQAVLDALSIERATIVAVMSAAVPTLRFAARYPHRVDRLTIYSGYARGRLQRDPTDRERAEIEAVLRTIELGWGDDSALSSQFRMIWLGRVFPDAAPEILQRIDRGGWNNQSGAVLARATRALLESDVTAEAGAIRCRTLVCHPRDALYVPFSEGRLLASLIPGAHLLALPGANTLPLPHDQAWQGLVAEFSRFLARSADLRTPAETSRQQTPALTPRQRQVLALVAQGLTDKQIGKRLRLSPRTVEMHVARAAHALGCERRVDAARSALASGLIDHASAPTLEGNGAPADPALH